MYAVCRRDDGAGQPTRREHVERKLDELRRAMEERGLKISRNNTEYLGTTSTKTQRSIYWERLKESEDIHDFGGGWRTGCGRQPHSAERMEELVESVVIQGNECEDQWEGVQDSGKTGTDVRGRDIGIEDGTGT